MKILALNQKYLTSKEISDCFPEHLRSDIEMLSFFSNLDGVQSISHLGLMPRASINNLPFDDSLIDVIGARMPEYKPWFSESWADVTDQRALEIEKKVLAENKQLIIQWSGGIDSTVMVVAVLKNFAKSSLEHVSIACNWGSVIENPLFFYRHIKDRLSTVDINDITQKIGISGDYICVGGSAADMLHTSMAPGLDQYMAISDSDKFNWSWKKNPDYLIGYVEKVTKNDRFGRWYYEKTRESIEHCELPVENYFDFMWWSGFNYNWHAQLMLEWFHHHRNTGLDWNEHKERYHTWFQTTKYQQWAMSQCGKNTRFGKGIISMKAIPKSYIFDYTKDSWYCKYKTKMNSAGRQGQIFSEKPFALTDTFEVLYLEKDLERIRQLLPGFILS